MSFKKIFYFFLFAQLTFSFASAQHLTARTLFDKMLHSIDNTKTCSYNLKLKERTKDGFRECEYVVKLNAKPFKAFVYSINPHPGAKALYIPGENDNKVYIKPNSFPYINLSLSPQSKLMRRNHLFTINQLGFEYIGGILRGYFNRDSTLFLKWMRMENEISFAGQNYYTIVLENNLFSYINYTVQKGETITSIAKKLLLNDNAVLRLNTHISSLDDVESGQTIKVPTTFGKKIILYINKANFLPAIQEIYDEKGLMARIEMTSVVQNQKFASDEFTRTKKEYGF